MAVCVDRAGGRPVKHEKEPGVPAFSGTEFQPRRKDYAVLIPVINEGERILRELRRAQEHQVSSAADLVLCDGGSRDVNTLLVKEDSGKHGAQLRMGIWWALRRGYRGIITVDGNDKDSIEDVPAFTEKLEEGYDLVQGSRFVPGGKGINTPPVRDLAVRLVHAPVISLTARHRFTDTTNAFRGYSARYLQDERVQPLRDVFMTYELLAFLSVRATQIGMKACEIPVTRAYPKEGKTPTKISFFRGNGERLKILFRNLAGAYNPPEKR